MIQNPIAPISGAVQLKKLRNALAISQARRLLLTLQKEAEATVSHDQTKRVTYLTSLFSRIHREIFHDWREQATISHRPGSMLEADKRKRFRNAIEQLVLNGVENADTALFDNNGFVIKTPNIAERLAKFYKSMRRVRPFDYGNRITLDVFMLALANLPPFKGVYEQGLDFRRLAPDDAEILHNPHSSEEQITESIRHAMDPARTRCLRNQPNRYGTWPENKQFVSGIPFLSHVTENGVECLVTVTGGLAPRERVDADAFVAGTQIADYAPIPSRDLIGYLPGTEELRQPGVVEIDGLSIAEDGAAQLFCLDINIMTGLRYPSHTEFLELLKECVGADVPFYQLANNEALKNKLLHAANGDERLVRTVEIAYQRLSRIIRKLDRINESIFEGKTPVPNPKMFMSMGGAGSGKTAVEEIATAHCGDNFVIASLDEFRKQSDLYRVLTAANHHSDDYVFVEPFANRLRDQVANHALQNRFNILYDGTGIPYSPRYRTIVEKYRAAGFHTQIAAVDAFIVKPVGRENELSRSGVIGSVKQRYEQTGRALPWVVTVDKHIRSPESFLEALEHEALDKLSLFANDGEKDKHYLVAECFPFTDEEVDTLKEKQLAGELTDFLAEQIKTRPQSVLKILSRGDQALLDELRERNPAFDESNVAYQIYSSKNGNRILVIYHTRRMVDFLEKRQLNPNASGEEGLLHKHASLAFHIDPKAREPWMIRLQGSLRE